VARGHSEVRRDREGGAGEPADLGGGGPPPARSPSGGTPLQVDFGPGSTGPSLPVQVAGTSSVSRSEQGQDGEIRVASQREGGGPPRPRPAAPDP